MSRFAVPRAAAALSALGFLQTAADPQDRGPRSEDIPALKRELETPVGMGAPVSQPDTGLREGPNDGSSDQTARTIGRAAEPVGNAETDRAQQGGSPSTVGSVSGPVAAGTT